MNTPAFHTARITPRQFRTIMLPACMTPGLTRRARFARWIVAAIAAMAVRTGRPCDVQSADGRRFSVRRDSGMVRVTEFPS